MRLIEFVTFGKLKLKEIYFVRTLAVSSWPKFEFDVFCIYNSCLFLSRILVTFFSYPIGRMDSPHNGCQ